MSEFVSNYLTYLTATAFGGACLLASFDPASEEAQPSTPQIARVADATETLPSRADQSGLETAVLEAVVFTASGVDAGPTFAAPSRPEGSVTGRSVNLREGPGTEFTIAGRAGFGDRLAVTGQRDGIWIEVVAPLIDRRVWIHGNFFDAPASSTTVAVSE
ncbi:MAG: SH3 domain-containing protein [Pseudomonadota bacterium]